MAYGLILSAEANRYKHTGIVLNGLKGPIQVKGVEYDQEMPAFNFLTDKELADVITYIRSQFGNDNTVVAIEDIANVRLEEKN